MAQSRTKLSKGLFFLVQSNMNEKDADKVLNFLSTLFPTMIFPISVFNVHMHFMQTHTLSELVFSGVRVFIFLSHVCA